MGGPDGIRIDLPLHPKRAAPIDPAVVARDAAVAHLGGPAYTRRDAVRVLLAYADLTSADGSRRPGPLARPERWRQSFALRFGMAIRGVL